MGIAGLGSLSPYWGIFAEILSSSLILSCWHPLGWPLPLPTTCRLRPLSMLQRDFHQKGSSTAHGSARQILLHLIWCTPDLNSPLSTSASDRHSCSLGNFELDVAHVMDTSWELAKEATLNILLSSPGPKPPLRTLGGLSAQDVLGMSFILGVVTG